MGSKLQRVKKPTRAYSLLYCIVLYYLYLFRVVENVLRLKNVEIMASQLKKK